MYNKFPSNSQWLIGKFYRLWGTRLVSPEDLKGSMLLKLTPFLEEQTLHDRINFNDPLGCDSSICRSSGFTHGVRGHISLSKR